MTTAVLDIWGGDGHQDHVARYVVDLDSSCSQIISEVRAGFLVNVREEISWGAEENFDARVGSAQ